MAQALDRAAWETVMRNRIAHGNYVWVDLSFPEPVCFHTQDEDGLIRAIDALRAQLGVGPTNRDFRRLVKQAAGKRAARAAKAT